MSFKKKMLVSFSSLLLLSSVMCGGTFALFTSENESNVNITTASVNLSSTVGDLKTYSLGVEQIPGEFDNGGKATLNSADGIVNVE